MSDLEREYTPSSRVVGGSEPFVADYRQRSAAARDALGAGVVATPGGSVLVVSDASAPLLVFVHGGYWQALSASESLYLAPAAVRLGWSYAAVEYTLAPAATVDRMIAEVGDELRVLGSMLTPARVVLAGHSAGAHLAAMSALVTPSPLPLDRVVLVSGVFDLRPIVHTTVNDPLGLDEQGAAALSPQLLPVTAGAPEVVVACGDNETDAFKQQSLLYAQHVRASGGAATLVECRPRHHFDIVDDLVDPLTELGRLTVGGST